MRVDFAIMPTLLRALQRRSDVHQNSVRKRIQTYI